MRARVITGYRERGPMNDDCPNRPWKGTISHVTETGYVMPPPATCSRRSKPPRDSSANGCRSRTWSLSSRVGSIIRKSWYTT